MNKDWVLTIGVDKFYLTLEEKDHYLSALEKGAKYVEIGDKILGVNFQSLTAKQELEGKYMCESGVWHSRGSECYCNGEWKKLPDGKYSFIKNKLE